MRLLPALCLGLAVLACASSKESARDEAPPAASAQLPAAEQKPDQEKQSPASGSAPASSGQAGASGAAGQAAAGATGAAPAAGPAQSLQRSTEPAGPMTASEAAEHLAHELHGAGGDSARRSSPGQADGGSAQSGAAGTRSGAGMPADGGMSADAGASSPAPRSQKAKEGDDALACASDADCGFTRVAAGACCPMLCEPRVVAKSHARVLEKQEATCNGGRECPSPMCRPPRQQQTAACVEHKCTAKVSRTAIEN